MASEIFRSENEIVLSFVPERGGGPWRGLVDYGGVNETASFFAEIVRGRL